jgi:hypothetical protein
VAHVDPSSFDVAAERDSALPPRELSKLKRVHMTDAVEADSVCHRSTIDVHGPGL